jgi:hypothetical protein
VKVREVRKTFIIVTNVAGWIARSEAIHPIPKTAASSRATAAAEAGSARFGRQPLRWPRCALAGRKAIDIRDPPPD